MSERVLAAGVLHEESGALVYVRIYDVEFGLTAAEADGLIELLRVAVARARQRTAAMEQRIEREPAP